MLKPYLLVAVTENMGRGVFTKKYIPADTVIEVAPVIVMEASDRKLLDQTLLHDYIFEWGDKKDKCAMALGLVPMYNHNYESNCDYFMDYETDNILIKTVRDVRAGEELTINYNGDWNNNAPVWFEAK